MTILVRTFPRRIHVYRSIGDQDFPVLVGASYPRQWENVNRGDALMPNGYPNVCTSIISTFLGITMSYFRKIHLYKNLINID